MFEIKESVNIISGEGAQLRVAHCPFTKVVQLYILFWLYF